MPIRIPNDLPARENFKRQTMNSPPHARVERRRFEAEYPEADASAEADTSDAPLTYFPASLFPEALSYDVDETYAAERPLDIVAAIDPLQVP